MNRLLILTLLTTLLTTGCVGTVEDAKQTVSKINDGADKTINFSGIVSASPISDSRIEVFFYPASGGSGKYTYDITVGSSPIPISIPSDVLKTDFRGLLRYTITGLDRLTSYVVKVDVRDESSNAVSDSLTTKTATTFDNSVADFNGISSASNVPGASGKDALRVRWSPARSSGSLSKQQWDPKSYEIVVVDSERLSPLDMDITTFGPLDGRWVYGVNHDNGVNEHTIRGLPSAKKFYVRMRAIHEASVDDAYNPRRRSELNTGYVTISTLSNSLADIEFQSSSFAVNLAPSQQGLNAINTVWTQSKGVFDHYRIYYSQQNGGVAAGNLPALCLNPVVSPPGTNVYCKTAGVDATNSQITGLKAYTDYEVVLVLCAESACGPDKRIVSPTRLIVTDPSLPAFSGIQNILTAKSLDEIGSVTLKYDLPNFSTGYFDGYIIRMRRTEDGSDAAKEITLSSTAEYHNSYNFLTDTEIVVNNIDYFSSSPYCFTVHPFKWNTDGASRREFANDTWKCIQPRPEAPSDVNFTGLKSGFSFVSAVTLDWDLPTAGVFSHYEIFWRKQSDANFNWGDAIAQTSIFDYTNYGRTLVSKEDTRAVIENIPNGRYFFGILTYYQYIYSNGTDSNVITIRSETNSGLRRCTVDSSSTVPINCGN